MQVKILSSLAKVFSDEVPKEKEFFGLSVLNNERFTFQLAVLAENDTVLTPELGGELAPFFKMYVVEEIPASHVWSDRSDDYYLRKTAGKFPDLMRPLVGEQAIPKDKWLAFRMEATAPSTGYPSGAHRVDVFLKNADGDVLYRGKVKVEVINAALPKQSLICTNWFHTDSLMNYYNVDVFSDRYWEIVEHFMREGVAHGITMWLTPLFTPPLDTFPGKERPTVQLVDVTKVGDKYQFGFQNFRKWVALCNKVGVEYFEMSHLFTQWGAKHAPKIMATVGGKQKRIFGWRTRAGGKRYGKFLEAFAKALVAEIDALGIRERCYFHVSDEPSKQHFAGYKKRAAQIYRLFPGFKVIDALSEYEFFASGATKIPVPASNVADQFYGKVEEFWTYYCCSQHREYVSNRYFSMPGARTRVLGYQLYKYEANGFLQWGYNYYFTQFSKQPINPYEVSDAGGKFFAGDAFVVYPGEDGKPLPSIRLKMCEEAFQDMRALQLLESLVGRENALGVLEAGLSEPITFKVYPHGEEWLFETREAINQAIQAATEQQ